MKTSHPKPRTLATILLAAFLWAGAPPLPAATVTVEVGPGDSLTFSPFSVTIDPGDTVMWVWKSSHHSVTSGTPGQPTGLFSSGILSNGSTFSFTFTSPGTYAYHCVPHGADGMRGSVIVTDGTPSPTPALLQNISTRLQVLAGEQVLIAGFIVTGTEPKNVILRGIGPSLPVVGPLANPVLELHDATGTIATNDNWKTNDASGQSQETAVRATGIAPTNDLESVIIATLPANNASYTAVLSGSNGGTGIGLVEGYDVGAAANSKLANISTRGFVQTDENVLIGGFILGPQEDGGANILIRALGPSLADVGVSGVLADPNLELRDANGATVNSNDNWKLGGQQTEIEATGIPPTKDLESALFQVLSPGAYTAIVTGKGGQSGIGLVEIYRLP